MITTLSCHLAAVLSFLLAPPEFTPQALDEDLRWRLPLAAKARVIQQGTSERHLVEGNYVAMVPVPRDGRPVDHSTLTNTGDMHSSSWTGTYLLANAFRLGWARWHGTPADVEEALDLCEETLGGLWILTHVSGKPGLLARKIVHGHGVASEERGGNNERNEWHQGAGEYARFRWRGHPSHHNYHHVLRGLAIHYYHLTRDNPHPGEREQRQIDRVRTLVREMMEYAYKSNDLRIMTVDGRLSAHLIWGVPEGQPSTRSLMATNSLRWAYRITGDGWYRDKYEELVERFGYRRAGSWPADRWQGDSRGARAPDHDDTEHLMASLWLVHEIEDDAQLKAFYGMASASIFQSKRLDRRSPYNYFYAAATGDVAGADLPGALATLREYPTVLYLYGVMNSIRAVPSREQVYAGEREVLPFHEQPWDNSCCWKNDPYSADDRYLAEEFAALAVSAEDPMVWFLVSARGALHRSLDGGETMDPHDAPPGVAVRDVTFAARKNRVAVLATSGGVYWTQQGGYGGSWHAARLGPEVNGVTRVVVDPDNPNVVWAVTDDGVFRSEDLGVEEVGRAWEKLSRPFPGGVYGLKPGLDGAIYAASGGRFYRHAPGATGWSMSPRDMEDYHVIPTYRRIFASPADPRSALLLVDLSVWGRPWPLLVRTRDGGETLTVVGQRLPRPYFPSEGSGLEGLRLHDLAVDPRRAEVVHAASPRGLLRSLDGGTTWEVANRGLRIPYAYQVMAPREAPGRVFASTPAGLYSTEEGSDTWRRLPLAPPARVDRGGLAYLVGYWPGRYFGYISAAEAERQPEEWGRLDDAQGGSR